MRQRKSDIRKAVQRLLRRHQTAAASRKKFRTLAEQAKPVLLPRTYGAAIKSLEDKDAMFSSARLIKQTSFDYRRTHPDIKRFHARMIKELNARKIPFFPFEFYRDPERQAQLYKQGVSRAQGGSSPHQYGCAVDLVSVTRYWDLTRIEWAAIGALGKEVARKLNIKVTWGGDFSTLYDPAHWQLENWRDYRAATSVYIDEFGEPLDFGDNYFFQLEQIIKRKSSRNA